MTDAVNQFSPGAVRVLCVDDEPSVRDVLAAHLRRAGYEVETAADGLAALNLLKENPDRFTVLITDNQMPNLNGIDLVEKLRTTPFSGRIVFFSSTLAQQTAERLVHLRVDAVVEKGRPISELMTALQHAAAKGNHSA